MAKTPVKWGIVGTGNIASDFCTALTSLPDTDHQIIGVASRSFNQAKEFASKFKIKKFFGSYKDIFSDPEINAIYIGTVTSNHYSSSMQALEAGKSVLCEKPMSIFYDQCKQIVDLAQSKNLLFVEGLWSKFLPAYDKVREILKNNIIGEVLMVSIDFGLKYDWDSSEQIVDIKLGGGTTLAFGCYAIHFANMVFNCEMPSKIVARGKLHTSGLDQESEITLVYSKGQSVQISLSTVCNYSNKATIYGTKGFINLPNFWCSEEINTSSGKLECKMFNSDVKTNYPKTIGLSYEIEHFKMALQQKQIQTEQVSHNDSLVAFKILDEVFVQLGVDYKKVYPSIEGKVLRWGIISAGKIANDFCTAMKCLPENEHKIVAVAARNINDAKLFAEKYDVSKCYDDYLCIAKDPEIDVVYIGTVNPLHASLSKHMMLAGKAVLCEKPMAMSPKDTTEVIEVAKKCNVLFVEGFWSRFFPVYKQLRKELEICTVGNVRLVQIEFGYVANWEIKKRLSEKELGGGVTLDLGCYAIQLATLIFPNKYPVEIIASGILHETTGVDMQTSVTLRYDDDAVVQILVSGLCALTNSAILHGTLGKLTIPSSFWCPVELETPLEKLKFDLPKSSRKFNFNNSAGLSYEIDAVRKAFLSGSTEVNAITHAECITIAKIQTEILSQLGVGFHGHIG